MVLYDVDVATGAAHETETGMTNRTNTPEPIKTNTVVVDFAVRELLGNLIIEGGENDDGSFDVVIEAGWKPFRVKGMRSEIATDKIWRAAKCARANGAERFFVELHPSAFA